MNTCCSSKRTQFYKKVIIMLLVVIFFTWLSSGCKNSIKQPEIKVSGTEESMVKSVTSTSTQILPTATSTMKSEYDPWTTIEVTQAPIVAPTQMPPDSGYLYKEAIVTVKLTDQLHAIAYLNLDDLSDNGMDNSDIEIERTMGSDTFYSLSPINNSYYGLSTEPVNSFEDCEKMFPPEEPLVSYLVSGSQLLFGYQYCVLTNENRIAIVRYVENSIVKDTEDPMGTTDKLSLLVTVFDKKVGD